MYLAYFKSLMMHKWFVFKAGRMIGISILQLLIHDLSKFSPSEFAPYARYFHRKWEKADREKVRQEFSAAWKHHYIRNKHHWQYWLSPDADPSPMPLKYIREMVADWMGASLAYTGSIDMSIWLASNLYKMNLHPDTRKSVMAILWRLGYHKTDDRWRLRPMCQIDAQWVDMNFVEASYHG